ncbi:MAG: hypothetical protein ACRBFS_22235 [Aureispira sp.]
MKQNNDPLLDDLTPLERAEETYTKSWYGIIVGASLLLGGLSAYCRPYFNNGGVHWEAIIALLLLIIMNITWLLFVRSTKRKNYRWAYSINTMLLWMVFLVGWSFVSERFMDDLVLVNGTGALLGVVIGLLAFYIQENYPSKRR